MQGSVQATVYLYEGRDGAVVVVKEFYAVELLVVSCVRKEALA